MPHAALALVLALAVAAINLGELVYFSDGYLPHQILAILFWAVLPAPAAYWLANRLVRDARAAKVVCTGLGLALALGLLGAWDVVLGPGRDEPLNGLIVVSVPLYQNPLLVLTLLAAWLAQRWLKASSPAA
jgi:hypothetical protein